MKLNVNGEQRNIITSYVKVISKRKRLENDNSTRRKNADAKLMQRQRQLSRPKMIESLNKGAKLKQDRRLLIGRRNALILRPKNLRICKPNKKRNLKRSGDRPRGTLRGYV
jgi:hypothetical protein